MGLLVILTLAGALSAYSSADTIRARLTATIGENAARTPFLLGEVSGIALDDSGRVYVADFQEPRVLIFAPDGRHLATIGRKGQGPGEFSAPTAPLIGPDGAFWVRNLEQAVRFVLDPATGLPTRYDRAIRGPAMVAWRSKSPGIIDQKNRIYFPLEWGERDGLQHAALVRYSLSGQRLDSLAVPIYPTTRSGTAWYQTSANGGRMVPGLAVVPFHPLPAWTISRAGTLISGSADKYELVETDQNGRTVRTITRTVPADAISAAERAESLRALKRRIDSLPGPLSNLRGVSDEVRTLRLPEYYPMYRSLTIDPATGELWVRRWASGSLSGKTVLDAFTPAWKYARTAVLPMNCSSVPVVAIRGRTAACVQVDPESGAESVMIAQFDRQ